ncbi:RHS repeat domain-containing protein [Kribbella shirazensis]|uniref:RHS repeat-associated protein n=1 Tax=Kribbella shirazensis TaxID=1105143 RepID=A0A7X5VI04_9ACTN|nr:RHS repeat-associated core domain-containing protein [Kribbella shirazensis]NIK61141.1 RHS repeat-associated protein [Kribbella shirazensis]
MKRSSSRWRRKAAATTAVLLALSLAVPAAAAQPETNRPKPASPAVPPTPTVATKDFVPAPVPEQSKQQAPAARTDWPKDGVAELTVGATAKAGGLPITVARSGRTSPAKVQVKLDAGDRSKDRMTFQVRRSDGAKAAGTVRVFLDYAKFRDSFGGDWASRLHITGADGQRIEMQGNDTDSARLYADVPVSATASTFTVAAEPSGSAGTYKATSLAPSGQWQVSTASGGFTWSYPFQVPQVPGGLVPDLEAAYSSQSVDGRTVATNNQPSWVGEGWDLGGGFIERSYKGCADDLDGNNGKTKTGDLCWETENAVLSLGQRSGRLILENGVWRPENDDGTKVEHLLRTAGINGDDNGEYWRITTPDGTQYYFGLTRLPGWASGRATTNSTWTVPVYGNDAGEPCHQATFAASACQQGYRWNLDYVVDRNDNAMSYYYDVETGKYGQNLGASVATYTRAGSLKRIEYGLRAGNAYAPAPARVVLTTADRCAANQNCAVHDGKSWPDVPWSLECATADCKDELSPTFWTTKRLAKINTQVSTGGANYAHVNQWDLVHSYPAPGDGTAAPLWLDSITRTGLATDTYVGLPPVKFAYQMKPNRVDSLTDGLPALNRPRIISITSESGGRINVAYAEAECAPGALPAPDSNGKRCFPVRWLMEPEVEPRNDWFHKYVVSGITEDDLLTGNFAGRTSYTYEGAAAWAYDNNPLADPKYRSWTDWRGYEKVLVVRGDKTQEPGSSQSATRYQYFRGMNGDRTAAGGSKTVSIKDTNGTVLTDAKQYAGLVREEITYNGVGGPEVGGSIHDPWSRRTAVQAPYEAHQVEQTRTVSRTALAAGGARTAEVLTKYDAYGNETEVEDRGDTATAADDRCTTTTYNRNAGKWLMDLASHVRTVGVACGAAPAYPADAIEDVRTSYDGGAFDAAPQHGNPSRIEQAKSYTGSTPAYLTKTTTTYDAFGRPLETKDALGRPTTVAYVDTNGVNTSVSTRNALGHVRTQSIDPRLGQPVTETDADGRVTTLKYDALGRLTAVWKPGRTEANLESPHLQFAYGVRNSGGPNWVKTLTLTANGTQVASYQLLDGFLRLRQTQSPSPLGGRILTDEYTNSRGLVYFKRAPYYDNASAPGTTLASLAHGEVPNATVIGYDGAERATAEVHVEYGTEKWRTTTTYGGDRVTVLPPTGGTLTTTVSDARGRTTAKLQYQGRTTGSVAETTRYGYTKRGELASLTDSAGNVWRYEYDVLGRKVKADDPDKGLATMTYDDADQLVSTTDARGKTITSSYDLLGRRVETRSGSVEGPLLTKSVYDTLSKGQLTSSTRYVGTNAYVRAVIGYDEAGRAKGEQVVIPAVEDKLAATYTATQTYADNGSVWSTGLPKLGDLAAETLNYSYDDLGLQDKMTGATPYVNDTKYTGLAEVAQLVMGPTDRTVWRTSFYDAGTGRLSQVKTHRDSAGDVLAADQSYTYDQTGNVTRISDQVQGRPLDTQCFSYDHLRRTTAAWTATDSCASAPEASRIGGPAPYWQQYTYDLTGNRTTATVKGLGGAADKVSTYAYGQPGSDLPHAVRSVTTGSTVAAYEYDAAGNTTSRTGPDGQPQPLVWDDEGQLAAVGSSNYVYDADGKVLIRRDAGSSTLFVGNGELTVTNGVLKGTRYYDGLGVRTSAGLTWTIPDRFGTNQTALNAATLSITTRLLDPFGAPRGTTSAWPGGNRGFVGGNPTADTGLTRLGAREYDPSLGRFLSVDPIIDSGDPQQLNAYAYSNNSPATFTDPDGLKYFEGDSGRSYSNQKAVDKVAKKRCGASIAGYYFCPNRFRRPPVQCPPSRASDVKACSSQKGTPKPKPRPKPKPEAKPKPRLLLIPYPENLKQDMAGDGSHSLCLSAAAGLASGAGAEGCFTMDGRGASFNAAYKVFATLGASAGVSGLYRRSSQTADEMNAGGNTYVQTGFDVGAMQNTVSVDPQSGEWARDTGLGLGAGFNPLEVGGSKGVNSGYLFEWWWVPDYIGDVPYQCVLSCPASGNGPV